MSKLKSRKLWLALAGICSGIAAYLSGDKQGGVQLILGSIATYLAAEGAVDALRALKRGG